MNDVTTGQNHSRYEEVDEVLKLLLKHKGTEITKKTLNEITADKSHAQLVQIPIEIITVAICELMETDETFADAVGILSTLSLASYFGSLKEGYSDISMNGALLIAGEYAALLYYKMLDRSSTEIVKDLVSKSQIKELQKKFTVEKERINKFVDNYIFVCVRDEDKWLTSLEERLTSFATKNSETERTTIRGQPRQQPTNPTSSRPKTKIQDEPVPPKLEKRKNPKLERFSSSSSGEDLEPKSKRKRTL